MRQYQPLLFTLAAAAAVYTIHKIIALVFGLEPENPVYTLEELYLFFTACSVFIIFLLVKISRKSFDNTGMSFLIATGLKMVLSYFLLRPVLNLSGETLRAQKIGFFSVFILFLAIETVIAIRILNNKQ